MSAKELSIMTAYIMYERELCIWKQGKMFFFFFHFWGHAALTTYIQVGTYDTVGIHNMFIQKKNYTMAR